MKKSVLMSIQPYWVFLIIARVMGLYIPQDKSIEVRKDFPKDPAWNKVAHIYCSKSQKSFNRIPKEYQPLMAKFLGKVIGEFVCDKIEPIACHKYHNGVGYDYIYYTESKDTLTNETQLTDYDMQQYFGCAEDGESVGYAWHISDLKIYDKPKELREFRKPCKWEEHGEEPDCFICNKSGYTPDMYIDCFNFLIRPPQSYVYVEEKSNE